VTTSPFVLDASIAAAWCFEDEASEYADGILDLLGCTTASVPALWPLEIGNVLVVAERRGRISRASATRAVELLRTLPIEVEMLNPATVFSEVLTLARETNLSAYDAAYLHLAMSKGMALATSDTELRRAAAQVGVPLQEAQGNTGSA